MSTTDEFKPSPATSYRISEDEGKDLVAAPSTDLAHGGRPAYTQYAAEMIALVGKAIMPPKYKPEELYYVLELAATYKLDPLTKELWAVRMSDNVNEPVTVMVGVEGLKKIASRDPDYRGFRVAEVYASDEFSFDSNPTQLADGTWSHVTHRFSLTGDRGGLVGAYCEVYREGWPPSFFWAPLEEYIRTGARTPWNRQKTAMIRKCAIANALRQCYQVSGLYIEEEMSANRVIRNGAPVKAQADDAAEPEGWGDEFREQRIADVFARLEELKPGAYLPGRRRVLIANAGTVEERDELIALIESEILAAGGELPPLPDADPDDGDVVDAEWTVAAGEGDDGDDVPFGADGPTEPTGGEGDGDDPEQTQLV